MRTAPRTVGSARTSRFGPVPIVIVSVLVVVIVFFSRSADAGAQTAAKPKPAPTAPAKAAPQKPAPATQPAARAASATPLAKPQHGFALTVPAGWTVVEDPDTAASIQQNDRPGVGLMVFVRTEKAPATVTDTLAKALVNMKNEEGRKMLSSKFDVLLDRPALVAEFEDGDAHYKSIVIPREEQDRSQIFYAIIAMAPKATYVRSAPALDKILASFQITPMGAAAATRGAATPYTPPPGFDRAKVLERILAPRPIRSPQA